MRKPEIESAPQQASKPEVQPKRAYEPPRLLWTEKLQTLAYACKGGPAPGSGLGCPN